MKNRDTKLTAVLTTAVLLLVIALVSSCTFKEPATPVWDVNLIVPLFDETYTMRDFADDSELINVNNGDVEFSFSQEIESQEIGDKLKLTGTTYTIDPALFGDIAATIEFPLDSILLTQAVIKTGSVTISVTNPNSFNADLSLSIDQLQDQNHNPLTVNESVNSNTKIVNIDLAGYVFSPDTLNGLNRISFSAVLSSTTTGGYNPLTITIEFSDLIFESISGVIRRIRVTLDPTETEINIPEELEGFQVGEVDVALNLKGFPFRVITNFTIEAIESITGDLKTITINDTIPPTQPSEQYTVSLPPDEVTDFINSLPTKIKVSGSIEINDKDHESTIHDTTSIRGDANFRVPLEIMYPDLSNKSKLTEIELDDDAHDTIKEIRKRLSYGTLNLKVYNHLPIGVDTVQVCFATDSNKVFSAPDLSRMIKISPGIISGDPGTVQDSVVTSNQITITGNDLLLFEQNQYVYHGIRYFFSGTDNKFIKITSDDYIRIVSWITAEISADFSDDNGEGGGS